MSVTVDATSGFPLPQSSAEWTSLLAGSGINNPSLLYLCQESSGNLADSIGSKAGVPTGSPTYANAVSGWSAKSVNCSNANCFKCTDSGLPDISTSSAMAFIWTVTPTNFNAGFYVFMFGSLYHHQAGWVQTTGAGGTSKICAGFGTGATVNAGSVDARARVLPVIVQSDHNANTVTVQSSAETVQITPGTLSGKEIFMGADNGANADPGETIRFFYVAVWFNADAEIDATHRATLMSLMTNPPPAGGGGRLAGSPLVQSGLIRSPLVNCAPSRLLKNRRERRAQIEGRI